MEDPSEKKEDLYRKLEISNVGKQKISINQARLVDSRFSQFSNEVSQLHLFDLSDEDEHKKEWIDTKGWSPKFKNPTKNDDGKYFLKQTFSLGQVTETPHILASYTSECKRNRKICCSSTIYCQLPNGNYSRATPARFT